MRFTVEFRNSFSHDIYNRFTDYIHTVHPCPFNKFELYWYAYSEEVGEAMRMIHEAHPRKVIERGDDYRIHLTTIASKRDFIPAHANIAFSTAERYKGWDYPDVAFPDTNIQERNPQLYAKLMSWCVKYYRLYAIAKRASEYVDEVLENSEAGLNTPGQLYRVWPEIASVMPQRYSNKVMGQKLTSTLPKAWLEHWGQHGQPAVEYFRSREYFDEINTHFLAMSVMDCEQATDYPSMG